MNIDDPNDPQEVLDRGLEQYEIYRVRNLQKILTAKRVQTVQLDREHSRLLQKYGAGHPLTIKAQAQIESNRLQTDEIREEISLVEPSESPAAGGKWIVSGYVLFPDKKPVPGIQVLLFDSKKYPVDPPIVAPVNTNNYGYFIIETDRIKDLPATVYAGVSPIEMSSQALKPEAGKNAHVEIVMGGGGSFAFGGLETLTPLGDSPTINVFREKGWTVTGKIVGAKGEGLPGLIVKVYDKDVFDDDFLGETQTNESGVYTVSFPKEGFSDFFENYPEVYLVVEDSDGQRLYDGRSKTDYGAGYIELLDIRLDDKKHRRKK